MWLRRAPGEPAPPPRRDAAARPAAGTGSAGRMPRRLPQGRPTGGRAGETGPEPSSAGASPAHAADAPGTRDPVGRQRGGRPTSGSLFTGLLLPTPLHPRKWPWCQLGASRQQALPFPGGFSTGNPQRGDLVGPCQPRKGGGRVPSPFKVRWPRGRLLPQRAGHLWLPTTPGTPPPKKAMPNRGSTKSKGHCPHSQGPSMLALWLILPCDLSSVTVGGRPCPHSETTHPAPQGCSHRQGDGATDGARGHSSKACEAASAVGQ